MRESFITQSEGENIASEKLLEELKQDDDLLRIGYDPEEDSHETITINDLYKNTIFFGAAGYGKSLALRSFFYQLDYKDKNYIYFTDKRDNFIRAEKLLSARSKHLLNLEEEDFEENMIVDCNSYKTDVNSEELQLIKGEAINKYVNNQQNLILNLGERIPKNVDIERINSSKIAAFLEKQYLEQVSKVEEIYNHNNRFIFNVRVNNLEKVEKILNQAGIKNTSPEELLKLPHNKHIFSNKEKEILLEPYPPLASQKPGNF